MPVEVLTPALLAGEAILAECRVSAIEYLNVAVLHCKPNKKAGTLVPGEHDET